MSKQRIRALVLVAFLLNALSACDGTQGTNGNGSSGSKQSGLRYLVDNVYSMSGQQVIETMGKLNQTEALNLSVYGAFLEFVFLKACQVNGQLVINTSSGQRNCAQAYQSYLTAVQYSGQAGVAEYAERQRTQLLAALKCSSGETDKASCGAYAATLNNANAMSNGTATRIIANMSPNGCVVGVDPDCY